MTPLHIIMLIPVIALLLCVDEVPSRAEGNPPSVLTSSNIIIDYYEPRSAAYLPLYTKLRNRQVLEELARFLAPVKWPKTLRLIMKECPAAGTPVPQVYYDKLEYSVNLCYQWFRFLESLNPPSSFATRQEVIVGGLVGAVLHAAGSAMFDMFHVPILGSDDDAADQISTYIALQFGPQVARTVVKGTYYVWDTYDYQITHGNQQYNFASGSSVPVQREYNILCIAYGGAPSSFNDLIDKGLLKRVTSAERHDDCKDEFKQVQETFLKTVHPNVDDGKMRIILSTTWINAEDLH